MRLVAHDTLGSTNAEALALARAGERGPLWITAARQTAGRGRRGRTWVSEPGNLYASLLLTDPAPPEHWPELSLRRGAGGARRGRRARARRSSRGSQLKWPNDLLLDGAKFAGILIEGEGGDGGAVAVGIGVNCAQPSGGYRLSGDRSRGRAARDVAAEALFAALSATMLGRLAQWNARRGLCRDPRRLARPRRRPRRATIRVRLADREVTRHVSRRSTRPAAWCCAVPTADARPIAAGDVLPGFVRRRRR